MFQGLAQNSLPSLNGNFLLQNYFPKEYNGNPQIFDIVQGDRGLMYFSNQKGVFEYDGISWVRIEIGEDDLRVLSLSKGEDGLIYVGADGGFGTLLPDSVGRLRFVSQLEKLEIDSIGRVSQIVIHEGKKYLKTTKQLIIISDDGVDVISTETEFRWISFLDNRLYVLQKDLGLFSYKNAELELVEEGYQLSNKNIVSAVRFGNRNLLFSSENGIYEMSNTGRLLKLNMFEDVSMMSAISVGEDLVSIGSNSEGIIVIDKQFNVIHNVGLEKGIIDAAIKTQYIDKEKNLWLGTNFGISKIEISSPVLTFSKSSGIRSGVESISRFNSELFVAALDGVYSMNDEGFFNNIGGIEKDCYGLRTIEVNNDTLLFVAGLYDVFSVDKENKTKSIQQNAGPYDFKVSPLDPNEVIVLQYDGLANLIYRDGKFQTESYRKEIASAAPFNFVVQDDGTIWIGTLKEVDGGVYKTHVNISQDSTVKFERFYIDEGLPAGPSYLFEHENSIYVCTDKGLYKHENGKFKVFNGFGVDFSNERGVHRINADNDGNIWMVLFDLENNYEIGFSSFENGEYFWNSKMFTRHSEEVIHAMFHEKNGISWLGGPSGLIRYDSKIKNDYSTPFNALIRSVKFGDSLIFGGTHNGEKKISLFQSESSNYTFKYSVNTAITFSIASTSFIDEKKTEYSVLLEGHDNDWTKWAPRTIKEYYLAEGSYSFKVKARNINGLVSSEAVFIFNVLPPWYRTTWAYILYVIGFVFVVYVIIRLSIRRVRQKNIQLEGLVEERTKEVVIQKQDAEKQRDIAEHQKELVEQAHREITDSINYAERIQRSFLATKDILDTNLEEYFVFFQPKEVVSGDFYWADKLSNGNFAMVNADSTGHGVPGAIMSILNISSIEKAVRLKFLEPYEIFNSTRKTIIERLKKDGSLEGGKDGMDASVICFDFENNKFTYTAAQNPIWIVRDGSLTEIKPEKMPVGKHDKDQIPFVGGVFEMKKGDVIYTLTDGFQDQFGGPKGKKFMVKKMREYILSISHLPMKEQHTKISEVFSNWKGDTEQVDDVCVIGVRV
jgi:serine phosphatase RsbU (regulator of sigma subunit)/ligand-binding sensor domain-containing protein